MTPESSHPGQVALTLTPPEALIIHCSDYRFQAAIQDFLRTKLVIHSYDLLALPGGAHFAPMSDILPKHHTMGKQNLKFLIEFHQLETIILIDHADCAFFKQRLAFFYAEPIFNEKQIANLRKARSVLQAWFPHVSVNAYFAEAGGDQSVSFAKIV